MRSRGHGYRAPMRRPIALAAVVAVLAATSACSAESERGVQGEDGSVVIRLADSYSPAHPFGKHGVSAFLESLDSSHVEVEYFPSGQMGNARDLANLVESEVVDIGPASAAYLEDKFPLSSVSDLPAMTDDACVAANSMMELLSEGGILHEEEYGKAGLKPLWIAIIPGYEMMTKDRPVRTPGDVEGQVLRSSGGAFDVTISSLGSSAVSMPAGDTYEALARGTIDGTPMPFVSAISYSLEEVANYSTDGLNLGSVGIPYVMSQETWDALTETQQKEIESAATAANRALCEGLNEDKAVAKREMEEAGVQFQVIDGADSAAWDDVLADVRTEWAQSLDRIGRPGTEVLNAYEETVKKNEG